MTKLANRIQKLFRNRNESKQRSERGVARKRMLLETLERRTLMAGDLGNFLTTEHVDLNIVREGNALAMRVLDDTGSTEYAPNEALLYAGAPSQTPRPATSSFNFIGVDAGEPFYLLPQGQDVELLFLGVGTESLVASQYDRYNPLTESKGRIAANARWVKTTLVDVRHENLDGTAGDGAFSMWQTGSFGETQVYVASYDDGTANPDPATGLDFTDGISSDDAVWVTANSHIHYNFGFSKPGRYEVDLRMSTYLGDDGLTTPNTAGLIESPVTTVYFSVLGVGQLEFDQSSYSVDEAAGVASIDVVRVGGSDGSIALDYSTTAGTASPGSDFTATAGTLEFLDGETVKTITVPILDDANVEGSESFTLHLNGAYPGSIDDYLRDVELDSNGLLGAVASTTVTILASDGNTLPTLSEMSDRFVVEGSTTGEIPFTVGDSETAASDLIVTATSSNPSVLPNANIVLGGSGANRTISLTSILGQTGSTTITVTVTDAGGLQASDTFVLTVVANHAVPFALPTYYGGEVSTSVNSSAAVDLNGDGIIDLVYAGSSGSLRWAAGTGNGGFLPEQGIPVGLGLLVTGVTTVDYDGDGDIDVVTVESDSATNSGTASNGVVSLHRNDGTGQFTRSLLIPTGLKQIPKLAVGVLNNDGRPDIVYSSTRPANPLQEQDSFYALQLPSGEMGTPTKFADYVMELQIADVNGDGNLDIIGGRVRSDYAYSIHYGDGAGNFGTPQVIATGERIGVIEVTDVTGDGRPDIVAGDTNIANAQRGLALYTQNADGTFAPRTDLSVNFTAAGTPAVEITDINRDGVPDVLVYGSTPGQASASWLPGLGGGAFGSPIYLFPGVGGAAPVGRGLHFFDVDGDTYSDIVAVGSTSSSIPKPIAVFLNKTGEDPRVVFPPAARTRLAGEQIDFQIYFGFPINLTRSPRIALDLTGNTV